MSSSASLTDPGSAEVTRHARGLDGWLFAQKSIDLLASRQLADTEVVSAWQQELARRSCLLQRRGVRYFHVGVPDKLSVMHEHRDDVDVDVAAVVQSSAESYFAGWSPEQLAQQQCLIDPTSYLLRQKGQYPLFWKSDTRWTPWSSYMAYQLLCGRLNVSTNNQLLGYPYSETEQLMNLDPGCLPSDPELIRTYRFQLRSTRRFANELALYREALGAHDALLSDSELGEGTRVVFENRHEESSRLSIVLFGDANSAETRTLFTGMLAETFTEVHFIWADALDLDYIVQVRPDVVITQCPEWQMTLPPSTEFHVNDSAEATLSRLKTRAMTIQGKQIPSSDVDAAFRTITGLNAPEVDQHVGYATQEDGEYVLLPSERYSLDPPMMVQTHGECEDAETMMVTNPVTLTQVSSASVFFTGASWWVHDGQANEILRHEIAAEQKPCKLWRRRPRLPGVTMMLATSAGAHCYYHWMLEILPKLGMLEREGFSLDGINHFLVREITGDWQRQTLARFGIDDSRIVETARQPHWRCEKLLHIDLNCGINLKMHRFIPQWMKHLYTISESAEPRLKIYVSRPPGVRRGIRNEEQILPLLKEAGFTIVAMEGLNVAEQARLLSQADVLMSPHGGALTNMVFCRPGITVIELFSRHVFPYYYGLAANCGHRYCAILENPQQDYARLVNINTAQGYADSQHETASLSFDVDVDAVQRAIQSL